MGIFDKTSQQKKESKNGGEGFFSLKEYFEYKDRSAKEVMDYIIVLSFIMLCIAVLLLMAAYSLGLLPHYYETCVRTTIQVPP